VLVENGAKYGGNVYHVGLWDIGPVEVVCSGWCVLKWSLVEILILEGSRICYVEKFGFTKR
jgi:hypothetical protein